MFLIDSYRVQPASGTVEIVGWREIAPGAFTQVLDVRSDADVHAKYAAAGGQGSYGDAEVLLEFGGDGWWDGNAKAAVK